MKIDFVISNLKGDGAQRVICTLANYLAENGYTIRIITFRDGDYYELHEKVERVRLHQKLAIFDSNLIRAGYHLLNFYRKKENRPDIVSSHLNTMGWATIPVSLIYGLKLTVSEHNNHSEKKMTPKVWFVWNVLYRFPDAVTILTRHDQAYFEARNKNVVLMPYPLPFELNLSQKVRDDKTIIAVGNLDRYHHKGFDNLIEIVAKVTEKHDDWKFMVVGEGDEGLAFLTEKAKEYGVSDHIIFAGYRSDVRELMGTSEIFMLSSRYEGLPMVLLEAASQGIACIAYDCVSGPSEVIEDGVNGFLVTNQDKAEMVEKTIRLIEDKEMRQKFGANAVRSLERFDPERIGARWDRLCQGLSPSSTTLSTT